MPDVVIVGAGISGLACAHRLHKRGIDTLVLESGDRIGGVIRSERVGECLIETGPSSLLPTANTFETLDELGMGDDLVQANPKSPRYIVVDGQMKKVPLGPLSVRGVARAIMEPLVRSTSGEDE